MSKKHIIHKLTFEIEGLENNSQYQKIANKISAIVKTTLASRVNHLLDKYSITGYQIVLESLELDLEYLNPHNLENSIIQSLEQKLNFILRNLHSEALYKIKHGNLDTSSILSQRKVNFSTFIDKQEINSNNRIQISKDAKDYFKSISHNKVYPESATYLEATIFYLEHGWLPRTMNIPEDNFKKAFTNTIYNYQEIILSYFEPKSSYIKDIVYSRIMSNVTIDTLKSLNKKQFLKLQPILKSAYHEKIQSLLKRISISQFSSINQFSKEEKKIIDAYINLKSIDVELNKVNQFKKLIDTNLKIPEAKTKKDFKSIDTYLESKNDAFKKKIKELLQSNDKTAFNKLLETDFYKSIVTSYKNKSDSPEILIRSFIQLILKPDSSNRVFKSLPNYINSEAEIINQLYNRSPFFLVSLFSNLHSFNVNQKNLKISISKLYSRLLKRDIDKILKSFFKNYTTLSPILNQLNKYLLNNKISIEGLEHIASNKVTQTYLTQFLLDKKNNPEKSLEKLIESIKQKPAQNIKLLDSNINFLDVLESKTVFPARKFSEDIIIQELAIENISAEFSITSDDHTNTTVFAYETLLKDYYIPSLNKKIVPPSISILLKKLELVPKKLIQTTIRKTFSQSNILKNNVLKNLSVNDFRKTLEILLPLDKARTLFSLYNKYHYIWKNTVDIKQVQLIFLSLARKKTEFNAVSIFKLYFDELKIYKGWTADVQKLRIINNFEIHRDKLNESERANVIDFIDNIPTMSSLAFKDSRKKLEEGIPVKNAGLVLIWPFFKTLFNFCEYLDPKGDFKNSEMRERAALLMQYIAVKSTVIEEPYLTLNKILVGLSLDRPIAHEIILTEKEKDVADGLLLNVIKQWPSFNHSSPDHLRGSFIIRDGILTFRGGQWVLQVEKKSYDLLLSKLPWSYSLIRLTWLTYMIKVEWN